MVIASTESAPFLMPGEHQHSYLPVLAHGGDIRVESAGEGKGSTFTVTLPAATEVSTRTA